MKKRKVTAHQPAPQPFAAAIGSVAASLPTDPDDEALIDRLMAKRAGKPAVPAEKEREESRFTSHAAEILHLRSQLAAANAENERLKSEIVDLDQHLSAALSEIELRGSQLEAKQQALNETLDVGQGYLKQLSALTAEAARLLSENEKLDREHGAFCWFEAFYRENRDGSPNKLYSELDRLMKRLSDIRSALAASAGGQGKEGWR